MDKATGWKVPIMFALGILAITFIGYLFLPERRMPAFPAELERKAHATMIDLDSSDNKLWKEALVEAASGFAPQEVKDKKLKSIIQEALAQDKPEVACAGAVMVKTGAMREEVERDILDKALKSCAGLHFALCVIREEGEKAQKIRERFEQCKKGGI